MVMEEGLVKWFSRYELCFSFDFYARRDLANHASYCVFFHADKRITELQSTEELAVDFKRRRDGFIEMVL